MGVDYNAFLEWAIPRVAPGENLVFIYKVRLDGSYPVGQTVRGSSCFLDPVGSAKCRDELIGCYIIAGGSSPTRGDL